MSAAVAKRAIDLMTLIQETPRTCRELAETLGIDRNTVALWLKTWHEMKRIHVRGHRRETHYAAYPARLWGWQPTPGMLPDVRYRKKHIPRERA
jgi:hypothetical protein